MGWPRVPDGTYRRLWTAYWSGLMRYHRYQTVGIEHLQYGPARLIVGYHGRPVAWDLLMLCIELERRTGKMPHGIIHTVFDAQSELRRLVDELGYLFGTGPDLDAAIARGEHILVAPGGVREAVRPWWTRYTVDVGPRRGYARLAIRKGLDIVPVGARGVDDIYLGLNDGYRLGKKVRVPLKLPAWFALGPFGLWPFTPGFPARIRQRIGAPIPTAGYDPDDPDDVERLHDRVMDAVQALLRP